VTSAGLGDDARRALELVPDNVDAQRVVTEVELAERARDRADGPGVGQTPRSAAAFVDTWIEKIAHHASGAEVGAALDPSMLDGAVAGATAADVAAGIDSVLQQMTKMARENQQVFLGWIVAPEERVDGDTTWVDVQLPVQTTISAVQGRAILAGAEDPSLRGAVAPESLQLVEGVPPGQRAALVDRLVGTRQRSVTLISFQTRGTGLERRIVDIHVNGISVRSQMGSMVRLMRRADPEGTLGGYRPRRDRAYDAGQAVGYLLGVLLVVYLVIRFRKRI
jgi:hypothetical protein